MNKRYILPILLALSLTANSQTNSILDKGIYHPFKDEIIFNNLSSKEMLADIANGKEPSTNTNIKYSNFMVTIYNYGVYQTVIDYNHNNKEYYNNDRSYNVVIDGVDSCYLETNKDTLELNEWVFNDISNKIMRIIPLTAKKDLSYKVSASLYERIWKQQTDYSTTGELSDLSDQWEGISPAVTLKDSAKNYFKIPLVSNISDFPDLKKRLALRDTLVVIEGEYDDVATIVYKNNPCHFVIDDILFRFDVFKKGVLIETKYLKITFSYGC